MNGSKNTAGGFQDTIRDSRILLNAPRLTFEAFIILIDTVRLVQKQQNWRKLSLILII